MSHGKEAESSRLARLYLIESLGSISSNFLTIGVFFYMTHQFGWQQQRNFLLSAGMGAVYIVGALRAHKFSEFLGRRRALATIFLLLACLTGAAAIHPNPWQATITILLYALISASAWPIIEHLITTGDLDPNELSRRVGRYNVMWAVTGAGVVAVNGFVIEMFSVGVFLIPMSACLLGAGLTFWGRVEPGEVSTKAPAMAPEPTLARQRVLALWLSRICVPAMYIGIYALAAMLPSLRVIQEYRPATQTLFSSVWLIARWLAFIMIGKTAFWHSRPRLLLGAAALLLLSFMLITLPMNLPLMLAGQILFGVATGMIYTASLYFGMVLSEGSTEHGGYHEALIGLGMTLGPAAGAVTSWVYPGDQHAAVGAVSGLIGLSLLLASVASLRLRRARTV